MFMPGPPEITPEQQAAMRREVSRSVFSFVGLVAAIRRTFALGMQNKLKLAIELDAPLPRRKFLMVSTQRTIKELKSEIKRRIIGITTEPIALLSEGYELMDDDEVCDVLSSRSAIHVTTVAHIVSSAAHEERECPRPQVTISRKEHGQAEGTPKKGKRGRTYVAETVYDDMEPLEPSSQDDSGNSFYTELGPQQIDAMEDAEAEGLQPGAMVAYKELEISDGLVPSYSAYRIARVTEAPGDGAVVVQILHRLAPEGKPAAAAGKRARRRREDLLGDQGPDTGEVRLDTASIVSLKRITM
ncbi:hypothetical protein GGF46_001994 [Coemansia sp. RSA 552]|nr:hypothetical protein GGF46_001994 [Coemansia sp. RSA 552]